MRATFGPAVAGGQELLVEVENVGRNDVVVDILPEVVVRVDAFAGLLRSSRRADKAVAVQLAGEPLPCRVPAGQSRRWVAPLDRVGYYLGRDLQARDGGYVVVRPAGKRRQSVRLRPG